MNDTIDTGGPAFPATVGRGDWLQVGPDSFQMPGMSLRDYFAAKVMHATIIGAHQVQAAMVGCGRTADSARYLETSLKDVFADSYKAADLMLSERDRKGGQDK